MADTNISRLIRSLERLKGRILKTLEGFNPTPDLASRFRNEIEEMMADFKTRSAEIESIYFDKKMLPSALHYFCSTLN